MEVIIQGRKAILKAGTVIEYTSENPDFNGSGDYSFNISFPLRGCPENLEIFGQVCRMDAEESAIIKDCEIIAGKFRKSGCLVVKKITEKEIECQFLKGKSEFNYDLSLDEIMINEMNLGSRDNPGLSDEYSRPWGERESVPLQWVNNETGNIQNKNLLNISGSRYSGGQTAVGASGAYRPHAAASESGNSYMAYMLFIAKRICQELGFRCDFSGWEDTSYKYLIICNALPYAWHMPDYAKALPHWSVKEFFEQLGMFLGGYFEFDFNLKKISFVKRDDNASVIFLNDIIDEFSIDISDDDVSYIDADTVAYTSRGDERWKEQCCDWAIDEANVRSYDTISELILDLRPRFREYVNSGRVGEVSPEGVNAIYYAEDIDTHFVIRRDSAEAVEGGVKSKCSLLPVNVFGNHNYKSNDETKNSRELKIIPAWVDYTDEDYKYCVFLSPSSSSGEDYSDESTQLIQNGALRAIRRGKDDEQPEYYSSIFVAIWDGISAQDGGCNLPVTDFVKIDDWTFQHLGYNLRLRNGISKLGLHKIKAKRKYEFSFLSDNIYDVRSIFYIKGHFYVCAKISASINENGISRKMKGEFYRLK